MIALLVVGIALCVFAVLALIWTSPGGCCQDCQQGRDCRCGDEE